ncbi:hypothetical protein [Photobacterium leiognathi]|uniref:hypothetical protein n=1 Tax=Photobacterium leiognathi TaxID=553611 RepID=UPI002981E271|nr:hypothetical protein [Photobacterium leiognathi]
MSNVRIQFDLSEDRSNELSDIMDKCGMNTRKELFNYALTLLEWAVDESEKGLDIAAIDRENKEFFALRMPVLNNARKSAALTA